MKKNSGKDMNNGLMKSLGFRRHPQMDDPIFNICGRITYWTNKKGLIIITSKDEKKSLIAIVEQIIANAERQIIHKAQEKVSGVLSSFLD